MTDNRTTELQKKLKEAGVKYTHQTQGCKTYTNWGEPMVNGALFIDGGDWTELTVENATPEQAIAATLGVDAKDCENLLWEFIGALDVADATDADKNPIVSDYARHIAATLGSGTCEIALARLVDVAAKVDIDSCAEILECVEAIRKAVKR